MRIGFVVTTFPVATETPFLNQITGLLDLGHDVRIHANLRPTGGRIHPDVAAYGLEARTDWVTPARGWLGRLGLVRGQWPAMPPEGRRLLRRSLDPRRGTEARSLRLAQQVLRFLPPVRYDAIQCCFGNDGARAVELREVGAIAGPVVTAFRGTELTRTVHREGAGLYRELFRRGDLFLPVSESLAHELRGLGCPPERTVVHHTGIDLRHHPFRPRSLPTDRPVRFLSMGRFVQKKGLSDALAVTAALREEGFAVEHHLVGDGPLREPLEAQARALPAGLVHFHGSLLPSEARERMTGMDLLLAPHRTSREGDSEGIPNVVKEAMALGMPVVTTTHSGIPELVEDGVSGLLTAEGDVPALVRCCRHLLTTPAAWPALAAGGRAAVEAGFDIERLNRRLEDLYRGLTVPPAPPERPGT